MTDAVQPADTATPPAKPNPFVGPTILLVWIGLGAWVVREPSGPGVFAFVMVGWILAGILTYMLRHSGLSVMVDRLLGLVMGFVRGAVVVAVFVLLGQFVQLTETRWWRNSKLMPYASEGASWLQSFAETGLSVLEKSRAEKTAQAYFSFGVGHPAPTLTRPTKGATLVGRSPPAAAGYIRVPELLVIEV